MFRIKRIIAASDPDDLNSPLRYDVETEAISDDTDDMPPARRKLLDALRAAAGPRTASQLVDWIATEHGHDLRRETSSRELNVLAAKDWQTVSTQVTAVQPNGSRQINGRSEL
ncbi:MAG TPA: hypothetical protein VFH23_08505 [Jiangellaceae bacterium]|nr:hypothetical protein [Jiangellaceae bacterium]